MLTGLNVLFLNERIHFSLFHFSLGCPTDSFAPHSGSVLRLNHCNKHIFFYLTWDIKMFMVTGKQYLCNEKIIDQLCQEKDLGISAWGPSARVQPSRSRRAENVMPKKNIYTVYSLPTRWKSCGP